MANALPQPPYRTPLVTAAGVLSPDWQLYFRELDKRVRDLLGGTSTLGLIDRIDAIDSEISILQIGIGRTL